MAHTSDILSIGGRRVKIATGIYQAGKVGKTQTINVFDRTNTEGNYEQVYRIRGARNFVTPRLLARRARTLWQLNAFLVRRGAVSEGRRQRW